MLSAGVEKETVKYKNFLTKIVKIMFNKNFFITDRQGPAGAKERHAEGLGAVAQKPECDGRVFLPCPTNDRYLSAQHLVRKTEWMQKASTFDTVADCLKVQPDYASLIHADQIVVQLNLPTLVRRQPWQELRHPQGVVALMQLPAIPKRQCSSTCEGEREIDVNWYSD
jgi:hypothetical protein